MAAGDRYATIDLDACACEGRLTVNSVLLHSPAFCATELSMLNDDADMRGADIVIGHGTTPVLSQPRRRTATRKDVPLVIVGGVNRFGVEYPDPAQGLVANYTWLRTNLGIGLQTGDGTVTAIYAEPDGTALTESVTALSLRRGESRPGYSCRAVLSLIVPYGVFT